MIHAIVEASIRRRYAVVVIAAVIVVVGALQIRDARIDVAPEFSPTFVEVQTEALGLSAVEVEQLVTVPLEQDLLNGVAWVETIHSRSLPGLSSIVMTFQPGTDMLDARQVVQERLTQAHALPNVSDAPVMVQPVASTNRVLMVGLSSDEHSLIDQSVLARWTIRPRLLSVPGVANVSVWGQRDRQLQILVDPQELAARDIPLIDVISTAGNALWVSPLTFLDASTPGTGGFIETPNQRIGVRHVLPISTADDLARVAVEGQGGDLVLGDIATVVEGHQPLIGDALVDGGDGLILVVEKLPWAATAEVTAGVEAALAALAPGLMGIDVDATIFRPASYVEAAMENGGLAVLAGSVLLLVALGLVFFQWRYALISAVAIISSLVAATLVLILVGVGLDLVMLAGLVVALAIVVDDGIVDIEFRRRAHADDPLADKVADPQASIKATSVKVRSAMAFAAAIAVLTLVPVFFADGETGALLPPLVIAYAVAIVVSTIVALTLTPALSAILLTTTPAERSGRIRHASAQAYRRLLRPLTNTPAIGLGIGAAIVLLGVLVLPAIVVDPVPQLRSRDLLLGLDAAPGVARAETRRVAASLADELRAIEGVESVGVQVGRAILSDEVADVEHGELWIKMAPAAEYDSTRAQIDSVVRGYPGIQLEDAQGYTNRRIEDVLEIEASDLIVRTYGEDFATLTQQVQLVAETVASIDGVRDIETRLPAMQPTIEIRPDLARSKGAGIKPGDVRRASAALLSGIRVGSLFEDQKVFDVVVWGTPETRSSISGIKDLVIDRPGGGTVRLGEVADVSVVANPQVIEHDAVRRYIDVVATVSERDGGAVAADINAALTGLTFPIDYHAELLTPGEDREATRLGLLGISVAVIIGVFLLMQAVLSSWRAALLATATLPLALVGSLVAVLMIGGIVSIGAIAGILGVIALASRYAILLLLELRERATAEHDGPQPTMVLDASVTRLSPILMTAVATAAALLPVLVLGVRPGLEVIYPIAAVMVGGIIAAVLVNLFLTPPLYLLLDGLGRPSRRTATAADAPEPSADGPRGSVPEGSLRVTDGRTR